eukprot:gene1383-2662_t
MGNKFGLFLFLSARAVMLALENDVLSNIRIGFGSCHDNADDDNIWGKVKASSPNVWIWLGDIVYVDSKKSNSSGMNNTLDIMTSSWQRLRENTEYLEFTSNLSKPGLVMATWDDHDFGADNAGKSFPYKMESRSLFLHHMGYAEDATMNSRQGVYSSVRLGTPGKYITIILLDMRFNKDDYGTENGDFLGEEQWLWLTGELSSLTSEHILLLGSSIQVLPDDKPFCIETWSKFPHMRERLVSLLANSQASHVVILSGDVHYAEINKALVHTQHANTNTPTVSSSSVLLTEVTSSGLTHAWGEGDGASGAVGMFYTYVFFIGQYLIPFRYREQGWNDWYSGINYGMIDITWNEANEPTIIANIHNKWGRSVIQREILPLKKTIHTTSSSNEY